MLSVVIPAYNEENNIYKCLQAFTNQTTKENFEVILVDNNCTDKTIEIAKKFENKINLKIISEQKKGRSPARRKGFNVASGEIIFSTDADTIVPNDWLEKINSYFQDNQVDAVTGTSKINDCDILTNNFFNTFQPLVMYSYRILFGHYWLSGFNFAVRKKVYKKTKGFDSELNALEDLDISFKISRIAKIIFVSNIAVLFSGRRFKNDGVIKGLFSYLHSFWYYYRGENNKAYLKDVR